MTIGGSVGWVVFRVVGAGFGKGFGDELDSDAGDKLRERF